MKTARMRLYLFFIAAFLTMHFTGVFVERLPYIYNAVITFSIVLLSLLFFEKLIMVIPYVVLLFYKDFKRNWWGLS